MGIYKVIGKDGKKMVRNCLPIWGKAVDTDSNEPPLNNRSTSEKRVHSYA